jgi:hypothetical protein
VSPEVKAALVEFDPILRRLEAQVEQARDLRRRLLIADRRVASAEREAAEAERLVEQGADR